MIVRRGFQSVLYPPHAEMYCTSDSTATIDTQNSWLAGGGFTEGKNTGFTFISAIKKAITEAADGGDGEVTFTAASHGLSEGDYVSITGSTDYDDLYEIQSVTTDTFNVTATWTQTRTGNVVRGSAYKMCSACGGDFVIIGSISGSSATTNQTFEFAIAVNTTVQVDSYATRKFANNDTGNTSHTAILTLSKDDVIYPVLRNTSGTGNYTLKKSNVNMFRVGE